VLGAFFTVVLAACSIGTPSTGAQTPPATHTPPAGQATATSATSNGQMPTVHMGVDDFAQSTITIPKGSTLRLVDDVQSLHVLFNGTWENKKPHMATEPGAPVVNRLVVGAPHKGDTVEIGPFTTAGTFHIYCVIHPGMTLTVVVQ